MSRPARSRGSGRREVDDYRHDEAQRLNNPEAGLARYETEKPPTKRYEYDPRMDPQLVWAGKAERASFEVDAVSIHVHERLSTEAIVKTLRKEQPQLALFGDPELDRDREVEFYQHEVDWTNRLILGDSLVVMTSLLERERLAGQVQCIYFDPPYGINYNSNFQARISNRSPREGSEDALTREPEQVQAYRDTWTLGVHSYLTYLRDRLLTAYELLSDEGSMFVQIGPDRLHLVRTLLDEIFGSRQFGDYHHRTKDVAGYVQAPPRGGGFPALVLQEQGPCSVLPALRGSNRGHRRQCQLPLCRTAGRFSPPDDPRGASRPNAAPGGQPRYRLDNATSQGFSPGKTVEFDFGGRSFHPGPNRALVTSPRRHGRLARKARRLVTSTRKYALPSPLRRRSRVRPTNKRLDRHRPGLVTTQEGVCRRDPPQDRRTLHSDGHTAGRPSSIRRAVSGTTAYVAEKHGRRWITCDTSASPCHWRESASSHPRSPTTASSTSGGRGCRYPL